jgi:hypothetical protein
MAQQALDPRIVKVTIEVNGQLKTYQSPMNITANGTRYGNALQNDCIVTIDNIDKATQDWILTETSPYNLNRTPKTVTVEAGRVSYGTAVIYVGNIINAIVGQPPDVKLTLKCLTGNFVKGSVITRQFAGTATTQQIMAAIAQDTATVLNFQGTNKNVANYAFAGSSLDQVRLAGTLGNYNVFIDNNTLLVKDAFIPVNGSTRILSASTGMIGIPEFTERGVKVKMLIDNQTTLGGGLDIQSTQYPAANGVYVIYKLGFQIASRETPFYYIAEAARFPGTGTPT